MTYNKKVDLSAIPFSFGIDTSGNYGYKKVGTDAVIPFISQSDIDNAYNKGKADAKIESNSVFRSNDIVGNKGMITDGEYNVNWVIYTISGNTYQLFPLKNLTVHVMDSTDTSSGEYEASEMYTFVHNTVLPNLKNSGLNITACDLVSKDVYNDICSKTNMLSEDIAGGEEFWLTDLAGGYFAHVGSGSGYAFNSNRRLGVRPLITVVK